MHHIIAQAPCLVTAGGEWAADYVVRTENMQEDMREVGGWQWGGRDLGWGSGMAEPAGQGLVAALQTVRQPLCCVATILLCFLYLLDDAQPVLCCVSALPPSLRPPCSIHPSPHRPYDLPGAD